MGPVYAAIGDLARLLREKGLRPSHHPDLIQLAGPDANIDLVHLAQTLLMRERGAVRDDALRLIEAIDSPSAAVLDSAHREIGFHGDAPFEVEARIQLDSRRVQSSGPVRPGRVHRHGHGGRGRASVFGELLRQNPQLEPSAFHSVRFSPDGGKIVLSFTVASANVRGEHEVRLRPAIGSSMEFAYRRIFKRPGLPSGEGEPLRTEAYAPVSFHEGLGHTPIVAEGHTNGTYPCRGPFVFFAPSIEPDHIVSGPTDYRALPFDAATSWSGFLFGP
jgi:hypothetical protein